MGGKKGGTSLQDGVLETKGVIRTSEHKVLSPSRNLKEVNTGHSGHWLGQ